MNANLRNFALWVIIVLLLLALFTLFQNPGQRTNTQDISFSQLLNEVDQGRVRDVVIQGPEIHGQFTDGRSFQTYAPSDPTLVQRLYNKGVTITARPQQDNVPWFVSLLVSWLPFIALIGVWIFLSRQMQGAGGKALGFGKSRAKLLTEAHGRVTFEDVAGVDEAKQDLQEIVEFLRDPGKFQVLLGLVDAGHVLEGDAAVGFGQELGAALAEAERLAARPLHLAREENPHPDERDEGKPGDQKRHEPRHVVLLRTGGDRHALAIEPLDQAGIVRRVGLEAAAVGEGAVNFRPLDQNVAHATLIDFIQQLREGNVLRRGALARILEQGEQREQQENDDHPEGEVAQVGVHSVSFTAIGRSAARSYGNL
jgi:hypothetical protein